MTGCPFSKALLIVNPTAGGGKARYWGPRLVDAGRRFGITLQLVQATEQEDMVRWIANCDHDLILVASGDGTFHQVINGWMDAGKQQPVALIPIGTGNVFASNMGIPFHPERALTSVLKGQVRLLDLGQVDHRFFHSNMGIGFDAYVVQRMEGSSPPFFKRLFGSLVYFWEAVRQVRHYHWSRFVAEATLPDGSLHRWERDAWVTLVSNMPVYAGGLRVAPSAKPDDGLLDLCILPAQSKSDYFRFAVLGLLGLHLRHPAVVYQQVVQVTVASDRSLPSQLDGEIGPQTPLTIRVLPNALPVLLPSPRFVPQASVVAAAD